MFQEMMCANSSSGGGNLKDVFKNLVLNGGFTPFTICAIESRVTLSNECGVVDDSTNKRIYAYLDFTLNRDFATNDAWYLILVSNLSAKLPRHKSSSGRNSITIISDDSSIGVFFDNSNPDSRIEISYGYGGTNGQRVIVYGGWTYN